MVAWQLSLIILFLVKLHSANESVDKRDGHVKGHKHGKFSRVSYPIPNNTWVIRMENMCLRTTLSWTSDIMPDYYSMYPLKFGHDTTAEDYVMTFFNFKFQFRSLESEKIVDEAESLTYFNGKTIIPECFWHNRNPAHFIFPLSVLFEWGLHRPKHIPRFDMLGLFKCFTWKEGLHEWPWGEAVLELSLRNWTNAGLLNKRNGAIDSYHSTMYNATRFEVEPLPYIHSPLRETEKHYYCFEEFYLVQRWGVIASNPDSASIFRTNFKQVQLEWHKPEDVSKAYQVNDELNDSNVQDRCKSKTLRIVIQRRYGDDENRNIVNVDEILLFLKKYSSFVSDFLILYQPTYEQISYYNSFDILITMAGSHLTNLLFTNRSNVAVIEVGLAVRDWFWQENAFRYGIKTYLFSHDKHIPTKKCYDDGKVDKRCHRLHENDPHTVVCPPTRPEDQWNAIGDCGFTVNIPSLEIQLSKAIEAICAAP